MRTVDLPNGRVDVVYTIDEGDKTGVKAINFVGNRVYSDGRLKDLMTLSEMNLLSFVKTSDVYDPDRLANDLDLIRRYYLKNGYADFRIASADSRFDDAAGGWIITITVEEGQQYRVGAVSVDSRIPGVDGTVLRDELRTGVGDVYNAEDVEKTLTGVTTTVARNGHPFAQVRPTGERDRATGTVALGYIVEDGPKVYIERINVRGNTRTRDYVVRRELDRHRGRRLQPRADRPGRAAPERPRLLQEGAVLQRAGLGPDRVVVNIDVEDQPTGSFSVAGGYSTADGSSARSRSPSRTSSAAASMSASPAPPASTPAASILVHRAVLPRLPPGCRLRRLQQVQRPDPLLALRDRRGRRPAPPRLPITEEFGITLRYSIYNTDLKIPNTLKRPYNDCSFPIPGYTKTWDPGTIINGRNVGGLAQYPNCAYDGEASIALKEAVGSTLTSLAGVTLAYSTLDNLQLPRNGFYGEVKPEYAGIGGDSKFFRVTGEARYYKELYEDVVGFVKFQGGHVQPTEGNALRVTDQFFLGPSLVRGFAPNGIGPRDVGSGDARSNAIGGTTYLGASVEVQFPIWGLPRDSA